MDTGGIDVPFEISDTHRAELLRLMRLRNLKQVAPLVLLELVVGLLIRGFLGGVFVGVALLIAIVLVLGCRTCRRTMIKTTTGRLAPRRLVIRDGGASIVSKATTHHLNEDTIKTIVDGTTVGYLETHWGQWLPLPREVMDAAGVRTALARAIRPNASNLA